jgi:hypothetical protein
MWGRILVSSFKFQVSRLKAKDQREEMSMASSIETSVFLRFLCGKYFF